MLRAAGLAGVAGLAGCTGTGDNEGDSGGDATSGQSSVDATWTMAGGSGNLTKKHYNPFNFKEFQGSPAGYIWDPFAAQNDFTGEFDSYLVTDWSVSDSAMELKLRDGLVWWDGSKVDATDLASTLKLEFLVNGSPDTVESVSKADASTVEITLSEPTNQRILEQTLLTKSLSVKHDLYKDFVSQYDEASSEEARQKARQELVNHRVDEPYGHGPWKIQEVNPGEITLAKHEKHPDSENINFSTVKFTKMGGGNQKIWGALKTGNIDGTKSFVEKSVGETFPESVEHKEFPANWGMGLWFNHDDPVLGKQKVRQAIAYLFDRETIAKNSDATKNGVKIPDGITNSGHDKWLGDLPGKMKQYEQNHEKAATLLKEEGFTKEGESWYEPNGDKFALPINTPAGWSDFTSSVQTMVASLQEFGIKSQVKTTDSSSYLSTMWPKGNFRVATYGWAAGIAYPYYTYQLTFDDDVVAGAISPHDTYEAPPVGEPDGERQSYDPNEILSKLATKVSTSKEKKLMRQLAWMYNYNLPCLPIQEKLDQAWYDTKGWEFPPKDASAMTYYDGLFPWLARQGKLKATK
jgi:peptide/nickel transport system substrate-binding protein